MNKLIRTTALIACIFSFNTIAAQKTGYTITAHIEGAPEGTPYYLKKNRSSGGTDTVASGIIKNNQLKVTGTVKEPELHFLFLENKREYFTVLLENEPFVISGRYIDWPRMAVRGPEENRVYHEIKAILAKDLDKIKQLEQQLLKYSERPSDTLLLRKTSEEQAKLLEVYYARTLPAVIKQYPGSIYTPYLINKQLKASGEKKLEMYNALLPIAQNGLYGRELLREAKLNIASEEAAASNLAPDFSLPDLQTGQLISLRKLASNYKYTYVDFWASWCAPCRAQFPQLKEIYQKYKDEGLGILGVSIDKKEKDWRKAIAEDQLPWLNVLDSLGTKSDIAILYSLQYIPRSVLIDQHGKIVARNIHGEKLNTKLKELLGN